MADDQLDDALGMVISAKTQDQRERLEKQGAAIAALTEEVEQLKKDHAHQLKCLSLKHDKEIKECELELEESM